MHSSAGPKMPAQAYTQPNGGKVNFSSAKSIQLHSAGVSVPLPHCYSHSLLSTSFTYWTGPFYVMQSRLLYSVMPFFWFFSTKSQIVQSPVHITPSFSLQLPPAPFAPLPSRPARSFLERLRLRWISGGDMSIGLSSMEHPEDRRAYSGASFCALFAKRRTFKWKESSVCILVQERPRVLVR